MTSRRSELIGAVMGVSVVLITAAVDAPAGLSAFVLGNVSGLMNRAVAREAPTPAPVRYRPSHGVEAASTVPSSGRDQDGAPAATSVLTRASALMAIAQAAASSPPPAGPSAPARPLPAPPDPKGAPAGSPTATPIAEPSGISASDRAPTRSAAPAATSTPPVPRRPGPPRTSVGRPDATVPAIVRVRPAPIPRPPLVSATTKAPRRPAAAAERAPIAAR